MKSLLRKSHRSIKWVMVVVLITAVLANPHVSLAGIFSQKQAFVPKWGRFDHEFRSAIEYANPLEDATLTVVFTSPLNEKFKVNGFWDGGKTWRVRFSPNFPGEWKFHTTCSDASNKGLNNIDGQFICTVSANSSLFDQHGPLHVARDKRYFEFEDHMPFFWLADTLGDAVVRSTPDELLKYSILRSGQKFSAVRWIALPENSPDASAVTLNGGHLQINPDYFRKLDAKADALNNASLLDAITPFTKGLTIGTNLVDALPDEQAIALLRYVVARWDANNVVWLLPGNDARPGRWKRIGPAVFGAIHHSPVVMNAAETYWMLDELRAQDWVDALGYQCSQQTNDDALQWIIAGPMTQAWNNEPVKPLVNLALPCVDVDNRASIEISRRAAYWSMLGAPLAGVTFEHCESSSNSATNEPPQTALLSPNAANVSVLAEIFGSVDFWRLRSAPELVANRPSSNAPADHIAAARSAEGDLAVIYVPQNEPVELNVKLLPASPTAIWIDARTGRHSNAPFNPTGPIEKVLPLP
ncbi:MAG TPA: DUF5060 domain-containing protein, partial [Verrucomicrobiae bacterium]|nr:DUF5060 domain-containing protein [Verrucomicrobiae bacterium]